MRLKQLLKLSTLVLSFSSQVQAFTLKPFMGVDTDWYHLPFAQGFGEGHFHENYFVPTLIAGAQLSPFFSVEGGWGKAVTRQKEPFYVSDEYVLGFDLSLFAENQLHVATSYFDVWQIQLNGEYPLSPKSTLFASAGFNSMKLSLRTQPIGQFTYFSNPTVEWNTGYRGLLKLGLGCRHQFTERLSLQASAYWLDTSRLKARTPAAEDIIPPINADTFYTVKAKDSYLLSLGIRYHFCKSKILYS